MTEPQRKATSRPSRTQPQPVATPNSGAASPTQLDPLVHERMRLAILGALAASRSLSFRELRTALDTSDGNVSVHCRRLEDAAYISVRKRFEERVPRTEYAITPKGREALDRYLTQMDQLITELRRS